MDMDGSILDFFQNLVGDLGDVNATKSHVKTDSDAAMKISQDQVSQSSSSAAVSPSVTSKEEPTRHSPRAVKARHGSGMWVPRTSGSAPKAVSEKLEGQEEARPSLEPRPVVETVDEPDLIDPDVEELRLLASVSDITSVSPRSTFNEDMPTKRSVPSILDNLHISSNSSKTKPPKAKYVPPKGKYSSASPRDSDSDQERFRKWLKWDNEELDKRKRALIGKTIVGKLSPKRGNRYFIKWNISANDTVVISSDKVEEILGDTPPAGMWVSGTIVGLGPTHVQWNKQHPYAMTLESRETRASHQPRKGIMPRNSPHWKKAQKAGLTREVTNSELDQRRTVPVEIDMARYTHIVSPSSSTIPSASPSIRATFPPRDSSPPARAPFPPPRAPRVLTAEHVLSEMAMASTATKPPVHDLKATQGANVNLVTGEVRAMGRSDAISCWRKRDRSFTV